MLSACFDFCCCRSRGIQLWLPWLGDFFCSLGLHSLVPGLDTFAHSCFGGVLCSYLMLPECLPIAVSISEVLLGSFLHSSIFVWMCVLLRVSMRAFVCVWR